MGYITADDGVRLSFETRGSGPQVVIPNGIIYLDDFSDLAANFTLIAYDPRNRGRSDQADDGDINRDVEDLDTVRRWFDIEQLNVMGHSALGLMVALYAMRYPAHVNRVVQIGPMEPFAGKQYPPHLSNQDGLAAQIFGRIGQLYQARTTEDDRNAQAEGSVVRDSDKSAQAEGSVVRDSDKSAQAEGSVVRDSAIEMCRKAWAILAELYVIDPADAPKIRWGRCELANERNFMTYWTERLLPSILKLNIPEEASNATAPVLTIHGTKDRNAPYGAGRDWVSILPNARLLTIEGAAHAPWIESPARVLSAMKTFFAGAWPENAEKIERTDIASASVSR